MIVRLGDGADDKAETLGGGPLESDEFSTGPKGNLFLGLRPARHQAARLVAAAAVVGPPPLIPGLDPGDPGGDGGGGDGGGDG